VARSFSRFFNWGEMAEEMPLFNWNDCYATSKEDGSLMILYHYAGQWRVNTRGSFADGICGFSGKTWAELFFEVLDIRDIEHYCDQDFSYVFEFCSLHNKVVRKYDNSQAFLLAGFH